MNKLTLRIEFATAGIFSSPDRAAFFGPARPNPYARRPFHDLG